MIYWLIGVYLFSVIVNFLVFKFSDFEQDVWAKLAFNIIPFLNNVISISFLVLFIIMIGIRIGESLEDSKFEEFLKRLYK